MLRVFLLPHHRHSLRRLGPSSLFLRFEIILLLKDSGPSRIIMVGGIKISGRKRLSVSHYQIDWQQSHILFHSSSPQVGHGAHYWNRFRMVLSPHTSPYWWQVLHGQAKQRNFPDDRTPTLLLSPLAPFYRIFSSPRWLWERGYSLYIHLTLFLRSESIYAFVSYKCSVTKSRGVLMLGVYPGLVYPNQRKKFDESLGR